MYLIFVSIRTQGPVVKVKDGVHDSFANILFGATFTKSMWATVQHEAAFTLHLVLALSGLAFAVYDIVTEDNPLWMTLCSIAVWPWGIVCLLLMKTQIVKMLLSTFTVWFLISQATIMCICIGYVAQRPIVVSAVFPSILASVLVDAFPQQLRRRVTLVTYAIMIAWVAAFAVALFGKFIELNEELTLKMNQLEFSAKAVAIASGFNLTVFVLHSLYILYRHPMALTLYTSNLKSLRFDKFELETNDRWKKINQDLSVVYVFI